ncbi:hypothetical protein PPERSA_03581 [Pseudocohnilembus persalinus]|uniref:rRNA methyltransferase 2, mitochondrial n=1 Tax=Pseudocohnilembus persalinus TaxID=266149 RepID=A0A0V0QQV5_PSEPJ|nr:hypothetical protein PPERSA_03581 [Pseudocohnilembus persalinus]|eukprot:KRX04341.1 hypothetical protein PPERSA_03581 [Pseudocohnilembus persalinus]
MNEHVTDYYVKEAIKQGYRSRASFKLIEMQKKYTILKPNYKILDLGAAPGGWTQVAVEYSLTKKQKQMLLNKEEKNKFKSPILAIDRDSMNPVDGSFFYKGDLLDEKTRLFIPEYYDMQQLDIIMSDMAPNFSGDLDLDHHNITQLNNICLSISKQNLKPGGTLLMKTLQGHHEQECFKAYKQFFKQFQRVKPQASRSRSSEIYYLGRGFKMSKNFFIQQKFEKKVDQNLDEYIPEEEMGLDKQNNIKQMTIDFLNKQIQDNIRLEPEMIKELKQIEFLKDFKDWEKLEKGKITQEILQDKKLEQTDNEKYQEFVEDQRTIFGEKLSYTKKKESINDSLAKIDEAYEYQNELFSDNSQKQQQQSEDLFLPDEELDPVENLQSKEEKQREFEKFFTNSVEQHDYLLQSKEEEKINKIIENGGYDKSIEDIMNSGTLDQIKKKVQNLEYYADLEKQKEESLQDPNELKQNLTLEDISNLAKAENVSEDQMMALWEEYNECLEAQQLYKTQNVDEFMELRSKKGSYKENQKKIKQFEEFFDSQDFMEFSKK